MESYRAEATIAKGGTLRLDHLPFKTGERADVVVRPSNVTVSSWPEGYFEMTFGAIRDETFERHFQGKYESREPLG